MAEILFKNSDHQDQFKEWLSKTIQENLKNVTQALKSQTRELMTREETAEFFSISLPTLNEWTKNGELKSYRKGNRVYYKRKEIVASLKKREYKVATSDYSSKNFNEKYKDPFDEDDYLFD